MARVRQCWLLFVFVGLRPFQSAETIAGLWDAAYGDDNGPMGEVDVGWVKPSWPGRLPVHKATGSPPPPQAAVVTTHQLPGDDSGSTTYPVDDVHQARITYAFREWG